MRTEDGWVIDDNNNRASIARWGSEDAARKSLETLTNCKNCSDCSDCWGCSDCSDCSDCWGCSHCSGASRYASRGDGANMSPIPVIPDIHKRVYEAASQPDALNMGRWHTCKTTHCRAGWVVHLAGDAGRKLEAATSTPFAAMMIYKASGCPISPCRFYDTNEKAMEDMRKLAEESK